MAIGIVKETVWPQSKVIRNRLRRSAPGSDIQPLMRLNITSGIMGTVVKGRNKLQQVAIE